uniref:Uncharacterized protein n=1 Tax=Arundo donax TaxID=35708 RepID=A0A0A9C429_ARUDO
MCSYLCNVMYISTQCLKNLTAQIELIFSDWGSILQETSHYVKFPNSSPI